MCIYVRMCVCMRPERDLASPQIRRYVLMCMCIYRETNRHTRTHVDNFSDSSNKNKSHNSIHEMAQENFGQFHAS
jgi:hypothetical protein